jgi:hypothetical protein
MHQALMMDHIAEIISLLIGAIGGVILPIMPVAS